MTPEVRKVLSMLGMARRAGIVAIGQDRVLERLRKGERLLVIVTGDCSDSVLSKAGRYCEGGSARLAIDGVTREELGEAMGVRSAQIAALPAESGFAERVAQLLN